MKIKLNDIKMKAETEEVSASLTLSEPKRKEYVSTKAKVIGSKKPKKPGELF